MSDPAQVGTAAPQTVSTLLCHRDVEMAVASLGSLRAASRDPLDLLVHDDGSLTSDDIARLADTVGARVLSRPEADERMAEVLRDAPLCRGYRSLPGFVWGLKLFDVGLLAPGPVVAYLDSDVLISRPVRGLFALPAGFGAVFLQDDRESLSFSVAGWLRAPRVVDSRINAGMFAIRRDAVDLGVLEEFLGRRSSHGVPTFLEQTSWAMLARRAGCAWFDPSVFGIASPDRDTAIMVGVHYTSPFRSRFAEDLPAVTAAAGTGAELRVGAVAAAPVRFAAVAKAGLRYRLGVRKHAALRAVRAWRRPTVAQPAAVGERAPAFVGSVTEEKP